MAARITYRCSNIACDFKIRLYVDMPVWKTDTPPSLAKVPVGGINEGYVAGYANQRLCITCGGTVEVGESMECPVCGKEGDFLANDDLCPTCKTGIVGATPGAVF